MEPDAALRDADESLQRGQNIVGFESEGWMPMEHYEVPMARSKKPKEEVLAATRSAEDRAEVEAH